MFEYIDDACFEPTDEENVVTYIGPAITLYTGDGKPHICRSGYRIHFYDMSTENVRIRQVIPILYN